MSIATPVGAVGSVTFTLIVGHRNQSVLLMAMFVIWVLSPFVGVTWAARHFRHRTPRAQTALCAVALLIALGALLAYGTVAFGRPLGKPALMFLAFPFASWLLIAATALFTRPN